MSEAQPHSNPPPEPDPSSEVANTQAPALLDERGVDEALEKALDEGDVSGKR